MVFFVAALGLLVHMLLWGAGAAVLLTPRPWRRAWPVFCAPMGLALQSAVVWAGAYSGLAGANVYARWCEVIPLILLGIALRRGGAVRLATEWMNFRWLTGVMVVVLGLLVLPMALASRVLTTLSLGSCDAADYAAGARVFQEFARSDRGGFIGLTEVVRVASVDNFYYFWLRLNHFTPSALIAFNGAVAGTRPHELTGIMTALLLVTTLPAVFWMARAVMRYPASVSLWLAAIYGLNPITWYAVAHVAMGQLLAANAIVFLTWAGITLWRGRLTWRRGWAMSGVLAMSYWLLLGSYNFIVIVALAPAAAFVGAAAVVSGSWGRLGRWLIVMLVPLVACGIVFTQRALGLIERFQLFGEYDFGWRIPALWPEGWLGGVTGTALAPHALWVRVVLLVLLATLLFAAGVREWRNGRRTMFVAAALAGPPLIGYVFLEARGATLGTNASYDAYKLLAVFFPGLLCAFASWATLVHSQRARLKVAAGLAIGGMTVLNLMSAQRFVFAMRNPPLIVTPDLAGLQAIEARPEVASINMNIDDFWARLWANALLLRKEQYFKTHTYEGRMNTALKGEWDLTDGIVVVSPPPGAGAIPVARGFALIGNRSPYFLRAQLGDGWYPEEHITRAMRRWAWSKGDATLVVDNPQATARTVDLRLSVRSVEKRDVQVWLDGLLQGTVNVEENLGDRVVPNLLLPPGKSTLTLRSSKPPTTGYGGDTRSLGVALYGAVLEIHPLAGDR